MRFKWGALLAAAVLGWGEAAVLHFLWPSVIGHAVDAQSGQEVTYRAILDLKRIRLRSDNTRTSQLILAYPALAGNAGPAWLACDGMWYKDGYPGSLLAVFSMYTVLQNRPVKTETDWLSSLALDSVAMYLENDAWLEGDIPCGITPEGKAQLMRNMLEVLRRRGESKYVSREVLRPLMQHLDHPAGPAEVPTARQIIRKGAQLF